MQVAKCTFTTSLLVFLMVGLAIAEPFYPSLRQCFDRRLQHKLEKTLQRQGLTSAVRGKQLSVALVDITDLQRPRVAAVNGDEMIYAASLPKIARALRRLDRARAAVNEHSGA